MPNEEAFLSMMIETLKLLACGYEDQKAFLPDYVYLPDELVISFSEAHLLFEQVVDAGLVSQVQIEKINAIDALFDAMQKDRAVDDPWTYEAVQNGENWRKIRALAHDSLAAFEINDCHPDLSYITYVGGKESVASHSRPVSWMDRIRAWFKFPGRAKRALHPHAIVRLKDDKPEQNLKAGMQGTILYTYTLNHINYDYEVEFSDNDGNTLALMQLPEEDIELVEYPPDSE
jgi:hypothetical protein